MQIFDINQIREIGATLARNKTRTFLTAFGIFWGTAMLALLWGGTQGLKGMLQANFSGFASNSAIVFPLPTTLPYKGYQKGMMWQFNQTDVDNLRRNIPELKAVSPIAGQRGSMKYGSRSYSNEIQGIEPNFMDVLNPIIVAGRFINDSDIAKDNKVAVLGANAAANLFGGEDPIGKFVEVDNVFYRVVGVAKQRSEISFNGRLDDQMLLPLSTMRRTYNMGNSVGYLTLIAKPGYSPTDLRPKFYRTLRANHPLHPDDKSNMFFMDISEEFKKVDNVFTGIDILILFVGLSSLIAGIIGVGNIMWIIVKERTKEFGIRRAIGAKPTAIMSDILTESAILTLIAGTGGICFAVGVLALASNIIKASSKLPAEAIQFQLSFGGAIAIMATFIVLGCLAGTVPALKAMRIKPIEALNDK